MIRRRGFLKAAGMVTAGAALPTLLQGTAWALVPEDGNALSFESPFLQLRLSADGPEIVGLTVDGLGKGRRAANIVDATPTASGYQARVVPRGNSQAVEYRAKSANVSQPASWTFAMSDRRLTLTSQWDNSAPPAPFIFRFHLPQVHSTVLGVFRREQSGAGSDAETLWPNGVSPRQELLGDGLVLEAPALMHFPGQGSMQLRVDTPGVGLAYHSVRGQPVATLTLPAATEAQTKIVYTLDVTAIYPKLPGLENDVRFDALRRNWLNALQLNPSWAALANNTASTSCAFCYYEYADIAALSPPLVDGLTALDVVRQTLDRALAGGHAYGLPAPGNFATPSSDSFPSMLIAAANCVREGKRDAWLAANYAGLKSWADGMLATDKDGNGLVEYAISGNSGIWPDGFPTRRPANWWDTIGFGHEDAYANALTYRALGDMAMMATRVGKPADAARFQLAAEKLRSSYYKTFFNPETGVLGGWRSADGELHDY